MKNRQRCGLCEGVRRHLPTPIANGLRRFEDHMRGAAPRIIASNAQAAVCMHGVSLDSPCEACVLELSRRAG